MNYVQYINRKHSYQNNNCLSIIAEIYEKELNIPFSEERKLFNNFCFADIKDIRRVPLDKIYGLKNWLKISLTELQEFDIIIYTKNKRLAHFAMYVGEYKIFDLQENQKSTLRHFNDVTRQHIDSCFRHKQLVTQLPRNTL